MSSPSEQPVENGSGEFNPSELIMHHILDSKELEVGGVVVHTFEPVEIGGVDFGLSKNVAMMWAAGALLLVLVLLAARRAKESVPRGLRAVLEPVIVYIRDEVARKTIDKSPDRYVPYLLTVFFFILFCNLFGLVPGMATATGSISVTAALALMTFFMVQYAGIREYGVFGHIKNIMPPGLPAWLFPIMLPVEILGVFAKPFALAIRLFANMTAGHVIIVSLISLIFIFESVFMATAAVPFALFIYILEILVAFIQAFIFTMLTGLFIGMAAHPAH